MFAPFALFALAFGPVIALLRVFYPEHRTGVNRHDRLRLFGFLLRHPVAVQGEGPSNGDGPLALVLRPRPRDHSQFAARCYVTQSCSSA